MDMVLDWNPQKNSADLIFENGKIKTDYSLPTAVILSLFTDARAKPDDVPPNGSEWKRGFWADSLAPVEGDRFGSKLWLFERAKLSPASLAAIKTVIEQALRWLIEDGVAQRIDVALQRHAADPTRLAVGMNIVRHDGRSAVLRFDRLWNNTHA